VQGADVAAERRLALALTLGDAGRYPLVAKGLRKVRCLLYFPSFS
jgi:hypothetical protein